MLKIKLRLLNVGLLAASLLMMSACTTLGGSASTEGDDLARVQKQLVGDLPLPEGARLNNEQSLILGGGNSWAGRLVLTVNQSPTETFSFFRDQYPTAGWTLVSSTKAKNSILVFFKQDRTATVEIAEGTGLGAKSNVTLTIAPRSTVTAPPPQTQNQR
jgi:hypothetical protein